MIEKHMTINKIIKIVLHKECLLEELDNDEKYELCEFIALNSLNLKLLEKIGFDVLKQCFFVNEYILNDYDYFILERIEFSSFESYYSYVKKKAFDNSCYLGYQFSENDLKIINGKSKINSENAYINYNINDYTYEKVLNSLHKVDQNIIDYNSKLKEWIEVCPTIKDYDDLVQTTDAFKKRFDRFCDLDIFLQYIVRKNKDCAQDAIVEYANTSQQAFAILFSHILITYGTEVAQSIIDNFRVPYSKSIKPRLREHYRNIVEAYSVGLDVKINGKFDAEEQIFYVIKNYYKSNEFIFSCKYCFLSFEETTKFLDNDLSDFDLSLYASNKIDFSKYKINDSTQLPLPK